MLGDLVLELARALTAAAPPPPALPYLGMDRPTDTSFHLLDELAARGIFRKYELVLDVGAGLGSSARWLAARRGCEVVATATPRPRSPRRGARCGRVALAPCRTSCSPRTPATSPSRAGALRASPPASPRSPQQGSSTWTCAMRAPRPTSAWPG